MGEAAVEDEERGAKFHRMDLVWGHLAVMIHPVSGRAKFSLLSQVAKLVLTLPHLNADSERVFSIIRHDKQGRESLQLEGTLTSLVAVQLGRPDTKQQPCFKFQPLKDVVNRSKSVTYEYDKEHSTKND